MDPRVPYSQSSSYMGLLNSQNDSVLHSNFPYESFPSSINIGDSEIPPFGSQHFDEAPSQAQETAVGRRERKKWTPADDELGTFWKRVSEYYGQSPHARATGDKREHLNCKQRWHKINELTNKFCGAYAAAERQNSNGQSENDVLKQAHDIFFSDYSMKFNLEHAWCILSPNVSDEEIRPEGIKAAKARRNGGKGKAQVDYERVWEIKKEDLEMKERLSKLAILDTLLQRKEPLSEAEEVVKNKLLELYTQPSQSDDYGVNSDDSGYSETEELIRRDQAELSNKYPEPIHYPPQPEVEFGFPQTCYCGGEPLLATCHSRSDPGRRYYTCENTDAGECHVWKWWDVAVMEEMRARDRHTLELAEKVDSLTIMTDYETEQKVAKLELIVSELGNKNSRLNTRFDMVVGAVVVLVVVIGLLVMFK
ncbi:hypothetical protein Bca101_066750 [Brassica carinata]